MSAPSQNVSKRTAAQIERLAELANESPYRITIFLTGIRQITTIPAIERHYHQHAELLAVLGVNDTSDYLLLLRRHLKRSELLVFTYITSIGTHDRMWILVAMDNGVVAMYNETKHRMWSLYRHEEPEKYIESGRGWWVKVSQGVAGSEIEKW